MYSMNSLELNVRPQSLLEANMQGLHEMCITASPSDAVSAACRLRVKSGGYHIADVRSVSP